jgi:gliding motility-associated-like protein
MVKEQTAAILKEILLLASFLLSLGNCLAQTDKEFWFVAPVVDDENAKYNIPIVLRMTSFSSPSSVTISLPADPGFTPIHTSIPANSTVSVDLSAWVDEIQDGPPDFVRNKGMLIEATTAITAYYEVVSSYCTCNPEVFALKGRNALGTEFYISSQNTYHIDTVRFATATTAFDIVATQDRTQVTITPAQPVVGHPAGVPFQVTLNKGQTFSVVGMYRDPAHHLQGSHVVAGKPIAITLKDDLVRGDGLCADLIGDQTIPVGVTGHEYIVARGYLFPIDHVYVLATADQSSIYLDGSAAPVAVLNKGETFAFDLSVPSAYITGDKDFYVYHVTGAGCELGSAIIPKLNCTGSTSVNIVRSATVQFGVMLITKNGDQGSFTINSSPQFVPASAFTTVPGTGGRYLAATIDLSNAFPAGAVLNFSNSTGRFAMGFLDGNGKQGMRYGFFSDFAASNITSTSTEICPGDSAQLQASGGTSYQWLPVAGLDDPLVADPKASPGATTTYRAAVLNAQGCIDSAYAEVRVRNIPLFQPPPDEQVCRNATVELSSNNAPGFVYAWSPAQGLDDPSAPYPHASPENSTDYTLHISDSLCGHDTSFRVGVTVLPGGANTFVVPDAFTPNGDGRNDCFGIASWGNPRVEAFSIFNRWGQQVFSTRNPSVCWDGRFRGIPQPAGVYIYFIHAHTVCGEITRRGTITLIR